MTTDLVTRAERKLARRGPGHWRNRWWNARAYTSTEGLYHPRGEIFGKGRWATAEIAEQKALEWMRDPLNRHHIRAGTRWQGAVFIPADDQSAG